MTEPKSRNTKEGRSFAEILAAHVDLVGRINVLRRYGWDQRSLAIFTLLITIWLGVFFGVLETFDFGVWASLGIASGAALVGYTVLRLRLQRLIKLLRRI